LPGIYGIVGNPVYGFSVCRVVESLKAAKNVWFCFKFQLVKLSNHIMRRLSCHFIPVRKMTEINL
jgi:hypothetical protein